MRLLHTESLQLHDFHGHVPPYATLSHRWGNDEVLFSDININTTNDNNNVAASRDGYSKLQNTATYAQQDGIDYIWVDTCCIDKASSAELSEAINSMYKWYANAVKCYVYLSDVKTIDDLSASLWFTRGWTLQELIASAQIQFLNQQWEPLGTKESLCDSISNITGISTDILSGGDHSRLPVCRKLYWASHRVTTREEDMAYCLLGLLGVSMPLLYGEGAEKAFKRLQHAFLSDCDDESIFAWTLETPVINVPYWGLLASSPQCFKHCKEYVVPRFKTHRSGRPIEMTSSGLSISLPLQPIGQETHPTLFMAVLNCSTTTQESTDAVFVIVLQKLSDFEDQYARVCPHTQFRVGEFACPVIRDGLQLSETVYVRSAPTPSSPAYGFCVDSSLRFDFKFPSNSPQGPVDLPAYGSVTFQPGAVVVDEVEVATGPHFMDILAAEKTFGKDAFDVQNLTERCIVGIFSTYIDARIDDGRSGTRIMPTYLQQTPYLVVGLEPLPSNALDTPAAFVRPWYTWSSSCGEAHLQKLALGQEPMIPHRRVPGGEVLGVKFKAATYRFRTYYEISLDLILHKKYSYVFKKK